MNPKWIKDPDNKKPNEMKTESIFLIRFLLTGMVLVGLTSCGIFWDEDDDASVDPVCGQCTATFENGNEIKEPICSTEEKDDFYFDYEDHAKIECVF